MQKFVVLYPPQPDFEKFKAYYVEHHLPLVSKIPGLQGARYSFDVQTMAGGPYACVFEADFEDAAALGSGVGSPEGQTVAADVGNFAQVPPTILQYSVTEAS